MLILALALPLASPTAEALTDAGGTAKRWQQYATQSRELEPARSFPYEHCFRQAAQRHEMPLTLLLAVARGESDFNARAVSSANALGLMQILWPQTGHHLGVKRKSRLFDPCTNVDAGARYLKELMQRYDNDLYLSLAAYNYGPGRIEPGASRIPKGAHWYSGYILGHLDYVLGERSGSAPRDYGREGRLEIIRFSRPYRATALVEGLRKRYPKLRLDVFRRPDGAFTVILLFADKQEKTKGLQGLKTLGFRPA